GSPKNQTIRQKQLDSFDLSREWRAKGFYHPDAGIAKDFNAEKAAGKFFVIEDVYKPGVEADMKQRYGFDVYAIPMGQAIISTRSITGTMTAISRTSKNPERAAMFLELLNTDVELYNTLVF